MPRLRQLALLLFPLSHLLADTPFRSIWVNDFVFVVLHGILIRCQMLCFIWPMKIFIRWRVCPIFYTSFAFVCVYACINRLAIKCCFKLTDQKTHKVLRVRKLCSIKCYQNMSYCGTDCVLCCCCVHATKHCVQCVNTCVVVCWFVCIHVQNFSFFPIWLAV